VYGDVRQIFNQQEKLTQLWEQMGKDGVKAIYYDGTEPETQADKEIIDVAINASNGDKFLKLHKGEWQDFYGSQSEADFAYIDIIAFYTKNRAQIVRIFRSSALGKRDKAKRIDYVDGMVNRSFDRMLPPIDFEGFKNLVEDGLNKPKAEPQSTALTIASPSSTIELPPGIMGEIAQYVYAAAPRPVPEIA
jgi:hypothetical protein